MGRYGGNGNLGILMRETIMFVDFNLKNDRNKTCSLAMQHHYSLLIMQYQIGGDVMIICQLMQCGSGGNFDYVKVAIINMIFLLLLDLMGLIFSHGSDENQLY